MLHPLTYFRLAFALAFVCLLWIESLFTQTSHFTDGDRLVFKYSWVAWTFAGAQALMLASFAEIARRVLKDRFVTVTCWLAIPFFALFVWPQIACERVELTPTLLVHRREPPHTEFNVDITWESIQAATMLKREIGGFGDSHYNIGYELQLADGKTQELPTNTVLTSAHAEINRILGERKIPMNERVIPIPKRE